MKLVTAIIQPTKLSAVREALDKIGVMRMTICDAQESGHQWGRGELHGGQRRPTVLRKIALEVVVNDDFLERTIETIAHLAKTGPQGTHGDGKILVLPVEETIRIGGTTQGPEAV